jgi:uncharacterized YigZ family protein
MEFMCPAKQASAEIEAKRSRFIGTVAPVFSAEEAEAYVAAIRRKHPGATHNAYAYSVGTGTPLERLSDDGEPRGTAGYPVLEVIKKRGIRNVACVVTRYFGGILLGAEGLLRAYGKAASAALDAGGVARYVYHNLLSVTLNYDQFGRLQRELEGRGTKILDTSYGERVGIRVYVAPEDLDSLVAHVRDTTSGKAQFSVEEGRFIPR